MGQIGLVDAEDGPRLQAALKPGQRLVSAQGDLWRWDGFRAWAEDAPSAAALRLQQLNRLEVLKQELEHASARADGARLAHEVLGAKLAEVTKADHDARQARRAADVAVNEANRALSQGRGGPQFGTVAAGVAWAGGDPPRRRSDGCAQAADRGREGACRSG